MDMTEKEFKTISHTKEIKPKELSFGIVTIDDKFEALDNKIDVEITLSKEVINKRMDNMIEIQDMIDTQKVLIRYLDSISLTAFTLLIVTCITVVIFYISAFTDYYNFFKIILPFFIGSIIGCIIHVCHTAKNISIEFFKLSEYLKRRKTK